MAMTRKKIVLEDGRYLIYYVFDSKQAEKQGVGSKSNPTHLSSGGAK